MEWPVLGRSDDPKLAELPSGSGGRRVRYSLWNCGSGVDTVLKMSAPQGDRNGGAAYRIGPPGALSTFFDGPQLGIGLAQPERHGPREACEHPHAEHDIGM